ncbi:hypothetical protein [Tropicibacter alexandrii]|uniref:hypothetical protein n=1 Tax=Tropicibacter alexandrii TaxID=2267683 RepID=UPI000EF453A9|nr:hypothetical protein [Tropicibacter alexandrii]
MSPFIALLSLYYLCDQGAALRPLPPSDAQRCARHYEQVKLTFLDETPAPSGSEARAAQNLAAYRKFKAWEAANPALVEGLRKTARAHLGQG